MHSGACPLGAPHPVAIELTGLEPLDMTMPVVAAAMPLPSQGDDRIRLWSIDVIKQTQLNGNRIAGVKAEVDASAAERGSQGRGLTG